MLGKLKASGWKNIDYAYKNKLQKYNGFTTNKLQIVNNNESILKICEKTDIIQAQRNFKWISTWEGGDQLKKRERILIVIFILDLLLLLNYRQVRDEARLTFSYRKIIFYWYYIYPIAYFGGGYLLSCLFFLKNKLTLNKNLKNTILFAEVIVIGAYLTIAIVSTINEIYPILSTSIATTLSDCIMIIYTKCIFIFFALGLLLAICFASSPNEK